MTYDFKNIKSKPLEKPRDKAWDNWAKFENIGDSVEGLIRDAFFRKAEGMFKDQRGLTLEQADGTLVNVGVKYIKFLLAKTDNLRLGDPLSIELEKELTPTTKGYQPTKVFGFYGENLPANADQPTVKELEALDRETDGYESDAAMDAAEADVETEENEEDKIAF